MSLRRRVENRSTRRKNSRSRAENQQQTQPTYDAGSGNRTRATLVRGERSQHCANRAPPTLLRLILSQLLYYEASVGLDAKVHSYDGFRISHGIHKRDWPWVEEGVGLCWEVHDHVQSFVLCLYTMHQLRNKNVSISLLLNQLWTAIVFCARSM